MNTDTDAARKILDNGPKTSIRWSRELRARIERIANKELRTNANAATVLVMIGLVQKEKEHGFYGVPVELAPATGGDDDDN